MKTTKMRKTRKMMKTAYDGDNDDKTVKIAH